MIRVTFLGHASFAIELNGKVIVTDPWFDNNSKDRIVKTRFSADSFRKADFILVSHEHFDHLSAYDLTRLAERTSAEIIGPEQSLSQVNVNPRLKTSVRVGDDFELNGVQFQVVPAVHPKSVYPVGFIIRSGQDSVYFAGDTYDYSGMLKINCKLAILPIGGTYTMDSFGAIKALKLMKAKYVIPCHYNTFNAIRTDVQDFKSRAKRDTNAEPLVLEIGESVTV